MGENKPVTVTLGEDQHLLDVRLQSGVYESASDVMRAALQALEREEETVNATLRLKIHESINHPGADIAAEDVFSDIRAYHRLRSKAGTRDL